MADVFYDVDTGEYLDGSSLGPDDYEIVGQREEAIPEPSWLDVGKAMGANAFLKYGRAASGGIQALGDIVGAEPVARFGKELVETADQTTERIKRHYNIEPDSFKGAVADTGSDIAPMLGLLVAAPLTGGGTLPVVGTMGAENFGRRYADLRSQGGSVGGSAVGAGVSTMANMAANALQVPRALAGTGMLRKTAEIAGINALASGPQTMAELAIDANVADKHLTVDELEDALGSAVKSSVALSPLYAAAGSLGNRLAARRGARAASDVTQAMEAVAAEDQPAAQTPQEQLALPGPDELLSLPPGSDPLGLPAPEGVQYGEGFQFRDPSPLDKYALKALPPGEPRLGLPAPEGVKYYGDDFIVRDPTPQEIELSRLFGEQRAAESAEAQGQDFVPPDSKSTGQEPSKVVRLNATSEEFPTLRPKLDNQQAQRPEQNRGAGLTSAMLADTPVVHIPVDGIFLSEDVPNFKRGANAEGIVPGNELGPYQKLPGTAPIVVWERLDGRREVITGRHRLKSARDSGEKNIKAQIVREADGFTAEMARVLDAELNILDDKGSVADYAQYFRSAGTGEAEAERRGLTAGARGLQGFSIATKGSPELYTLHQNGRISDRKAAAIANAAPSNADVQRAGIKFALEGNRDAAEVFSFLKAVQLETADGAVQSDLFGADDSVIRSGQEMARRARGYQRSVAEDLKAIEGAAKRPEKAKSGGVDVKKVEATRQRVADLKAEQSRWDEWWKFPDLVNRLKGLVSDEKGGTRILSDFANLFSKDGIEQVAKDNNINEGNITRKEWADSERFLGGEVDLPLGKKIDTSLIRAVASAYRHAVIFPKTLAEKVPLFRGFFDAASNQEKNKYTISRGINEKLKPYWELSDRSKVNAALIKHRLMTKEGRTFQATPENLAKIGLSPDEANAYQAVRDGMDTALDTARQAAMSRARQIEDPNERLQYLQKVNDSFDSLRAENYVPFSRFGQYTVEVRGPDGEVQHFSMHESKRDQMAAAKRLKLAGNDVTIGKMPVSDIEAYNYMPPELVVKLGNLDFGARSGDAPQGFPKHFERAALVDGFEHNLDRAISDYVTSLSRWSAKQIAAPEYDAAFKRLDPAKDVELLKYARKYVDYQTKVTPEAAKVRQYLANYYLGLNVKSAALNLTQTLTTTGPELTKYVGFGKAPAVLLRAHKLAASYLTSPDSFMKANPELGVAIKQAVYDGTISEQVYRELSGRSRGGSGKSITDFTMALFDSAERYNRLVTMIAGMDAANRQGLKGSDAFKFAEKFVSDTQFDYTKANRPQIARGRKAALFTFRLFAGNWLRLTRNNMTAKDWPTAVALLGSMGALGGATAMPFAKWVISALESNGEDPKRRARELIGNKAIADSLMYGLPYSLAGVNLSGAVGMGELAPDLEQGVLPAAGRFTFGVLADQAQRVGKAKYFLSELDRPDRAVEAVLPEFARQAARGVRVAREGLRTPKREPMLFDKKGKPRDATAYEIGAYGLGFTPSGFADAYERQHSVDLERQAASDNDNINFKIAQARYLKDRKLEASLRKDIAARNKELPASRRIRVNETSIKGFMSRMKGEDREKSIPKKAREEVRKIEKNFN